MAERKAKGRVNSTPTPHDLAFKQFLTHPETARDFMQLHLPAELQVVCDFTTLRLESGSFVEDNLRPYFSDILYIPKIIRVACRRKEKAVDEHRQTM